MNRSSINKIMSKLLARYSFDHIFHLDMEFDDDIIIRMNISKN